MAEEEVKIGTIPFDPRFPSPNQTRHCYFSYIDFYRCTNLHKNIDEPICSYYKKAYTTLCPNAWIEKWDEQRENGTFPRSLEVGKK